MSSIQSLIDELLRKSREYYADIGEPYHSEDYRIFFEGFTDMPQEDDFTGVITRTGNARTQLSWGGSNQGSVDDPAGGDSVNVNLTLLDINSIAGELDEWRGNAASSFRDNVQTPFPGVVTNMFIAASVIHNAALAEQALWKNANDVVEGIFEAAINAVESLDDCNPDEFVALVNVLAAIAAVAIAGPGAATGLAAVRAATTISKEGKEFNTGSGEPMFILANTRSALQGVIDDMESGEGQVQAALEGVSAWLSSAPGEYGLAERPSLADGPGGLGGMK